MSVHSHLTPAQLSALAAMIAGELVEPVTDALAERMEQGVRPPKPWLTRAELADALRCSESKVDRLRRSGRIPFLETGRGPRFSLRAVENALQPAAGVR